MGSAQAKMMEENREAMMNAQLQVQLARELYVLSYNVSQHSHETCGYMYIVYRWV